MWCGGHEASSCQDCPQGNGASWCNGDCKWNNNQCVALKAILAGISSILSILKIFTYSVRHNLPLFFQGYLEKIIITQQSLPQKEIYYIHIQNGASNMKLSLISWLKNCLNHGQMFSILRIMILIRNGGGHLGVVLPFWDFIIFTKYQKWKS